MRILVVEDESDLLDGITKALREDGFAVDTAHEGQEGLAKAISWEYDAIILDWMLPGIDGIELLRRLRPQKSTPVILLTARDSITDRVKGLDQGADDYLVKPFALSELKARVRSLIRRNVGQPDPKITVKDILVNTAQQQVYRNGEPIDLTAREYRLVELLVTHRNRIVSRTMVYDHLFDENHDSMSNLVDVYISRLRSKLGKTFVKTRRGVGYIIDA